MCRTVLRYPSPFCVQRTPFTVETMSKARGRMSEIEDWRSEARSRRTDVEGGNAGFRAKCDANRMDWEVPEGKGLGS